MLAPKKFFSIDTGLSNAVGFKVTENVGKAMENLVAVELLRRRSYWNESWEIFYWKDYRQREVDFIIKEGAKVKKLIQVCREVNVENREREVEALLVAMKEFGLKEGLILTFDQESEERIDNKIVRYIPLWKWLLEVVED
jgi:predicted AAA+ superfamily ATPase